MARMMKSRHHDGVDPNWFHFQCFWPKGTVFIQCVRYRPRQFCREFYTFQEELIHFHPVIFNRQKLKNAKGWGLNTGETEKIEGLHALRMEDQEKVEKEDG